MRGLLLRQERSRELFAREQGGLFEGALDKVQSLHSGVCGIPVVWNCTQPLHSGECYGSGNTAL